MENPAEPPTPKVYGEGADIALSQVTRHLRRSMETVNDLAPADHVALAPIVDHEGQTHHLEHPDTEKIEADESPHRIKIFLRNGTIISCTLMAAIVAARRIQAHHKGAKKK